MRTVKLLWIATKSPWPPVDGGRLVQWLTLAALKHQGVEATVVVPWVETPADRRSRTAAAEALAEICTPHLVTAGTGTLRPLASALPGGPPLSRARHRRPEVQSRVDRLVTAGRWDAVHVEQLQAIDQAGPAFRSGLPVVLRAQNVESELWRQVADRSSGLRRILARRETRRMERWEGRSVRAATCTVALTARDADRLRRLSGGEAVEAIPAPFPGNLPAGPADLPGEPAVVVLSGDRGWLPNREAEDWFVKEIWPAVVGRLPGARLHLFSGAAGSRRGLAGSIRTHPPPEDSARAFAAGSILAVPLRIASGVRMKILEAWARGVPVVATPEAAAGLEPETGDLIALASDPPGFARAVARLHEDPESRRRTCAAARRALAERHDPETVARRWLAVYSAVSAA